MMPVTILVGLGVLLLGRQLFWLFVGGAGFAAGLVVAHTLTAGRTEGTALLIALAAGVVGALLAVFVERLAIGAAGFLAGGRIGVDLLQGSSLAAHGSWLLFVIGGVVGAVLVAALFDWALILLSSLLGATLIARQIVAGPSFQLLLVVLVAVGVLVQSRLLRRSGRRWRL